MLLLERLDFIGLIGLLVQAFLAWVFVTILASLQRSERSSRAFDDFYFAFVVLAISLTVLSVRFLQAHGTSSSDRFWDDGGWAPTLCYVLYQGLKGAFGLLLV